MIADIKPDDRYKVHVYVVGHAKPLTIYCAEFNFTGTPSGSGEFSAKKKGADAVFIFIPANAFLGFQVLEQLAE